jgi:hypothetical protein
MSSVATRLVTPAAATTTSTLPNASKHSSRSRERGRVRHVHRLAQRPPPFGFNRRGDFVDDGGPASGRDDVGACVSQAEGQRPADAGGPSNHDDRFTGEIEWIRHQRATFRRERAAVVGVCVAVSRAWYERERSR